MPVQPNDSFTIQTIQLREFNFKQKNGLKNTEPLKLQQGFDTRYKALEKTQYSIFLGHELKVNQNDQLIYSVDSFIMAQIKVSDNFDKKLFSNIIAILYSYLRPLVAQVTVMAKLPPLDLPPLDVREVEIYEIED